MDAEPAGSGVPTSGYVPPVAGPPPLPPVTFPTPERAIDLPYIGGSGQADLPRAAAQFENYRGIVIGAGAAVLGVVIAVLVAPKSFAAAALVLLFFTGGGLLGCTASVRSNRQLQAAPEQGAQQYRSSTAVSFESPAPTAAIADSEVMRAWLGPVFDNTHVITGSTFLSEEHIRSTANTLLFTDTQIVAVLLGPKDVPAQSVGGAWSQLGLSEIVNAPASTGDEMSQFATLYANHWQALVDFALRPGMHLLAQDHLTYAIPYSQIVSVKMRRGRLNPGLTISLGDGRELKYASWGIDPLEPVQRVLGTHVRIVE